MSLYEQFVVPYCIELGCGLKALQPYREQTARGLHGTVLEIGFGSGLNLPHLPNAVHKVLAVDPSEVSRRLGKKRIEQARCEIQTLGLDAQRIGAENASADCALSTFTLCTIPNPHHALQEVKRILKPGGRFHFLEHGRAPDAGVARWQDRLNGVQRAMCGGCNINRNMREIIERAGFQIETLETQYLPGPRTHSYVYMGSAVPA